MELGIRLAAMVLFCAAAAVAATMTLGEVPAHGIFASGAMAVGYALGWHHARTFKMG